MSLRIEIQEQPERDRFWAEVEVGGMIARRRDVISPRADGLAGILAAARAVAEEFDPRLKAQAEAPPLGAGIEPEPEAVQEPQREEDDTETLRAEARDLGVRVDGRWSVGRLQQEIDAALARPRQAEHADDA